MSIISISNLTKLYNKGRSSQVEALRGISLEIEQHELLAIEGRSGAGKSTLMNIIGCIDSLTAGKYLLDGVDVSSLADSKLSRIRNEHIGIVLQDFGLINHRSVLDNVVVPLIFGKVSATKISQLGKDALEKVGILDLSKRRIEELSGGQKQRVAIARAIVNNADIILADEPTGALDTKTSHEIMELLSSLNKQGKCIVIITHDKLVSSYCKRIIEISDGLIVSDTLNENVATCL